MKNLYGMNGVVTWTEEEISAREMFVKYLSDGIISAYKSVNRAFSSRRIESSILTPLELINENYTPDDFFAIDAYALRPETTMGSYAYARSIAQEEKRPFPLIVWQLGKSFRKEQDQPTKFMRLKEFYQLELQVLYDVSTQNDYYKLAVDTALGLVRMFFPFARTVLSDRLPSYSTITTDIEVDEMEVCSISQRTDFDGYKNTEIAFGADRLVYKWLSKITNN